MMYMIIFIDNFCRCIWIDFMKEKLEAITKFKEFNEKVENEVGWKIKCVRIDNGGEYTSNEFSRFLQESHEYLTCEKRAFMFWAKCMKMVVHITNVLPQPNLDFVSPIENL